MKVSDEECVHLARLHRLHVWMNEAGTRVEYRSSEYAKITGVEVRIIRNKVTLKTSLHKFWNERQYGLLRNDNMFTLAEAKAAFEMLLFENGFIASKVRVVQFELGLNLPVSYDPLTFIESVRYICYNDKQMFVDANYKLNRQRTTMKHKDIRRYFKIYDKSFEMDEKRRKPRIEGRENKNILRIETVYKRHDERSDTFFSSANVNRLVQRFFADWSGLFFSRRVQADKGARKSEIERALKIINDGADEYMESVRSEYDSGRMTEKQFRTIREFVRDFEANSLKYRVIILPQEKEYKRLLGELYKIIVQ